jgi:hypothetical protein
MAANTLARGAPNPGTGAAMAMVAAASTRKLNFRLCFQLHQLFLLSRMLKLLSQSRKMVNQRQERLDVSLRKNP